VSSIPWMTSSYACWHRMHRLHHWIIVMSVPIVVDWRFLECRLITKMLP
jgi:hypothetical protein